MDPLWLKWLTRGRPIQLEMPSTSQTNERRDSRAQITNTNNNERNHNHAPPSDNVTDHNRHNQNETRLSNTSRNGHPRQETNNQAHSDSFMFQLPQFDINLYQQKKTLSQGMMDLALLSANANQLRVMIEQPKANRDGFFFVTTACIVISLLLQVTVGIGLIWNGRYDVKVETEYHKANKVNNFTMIGIFLITILNVFISAFFVPSSSIGTLPSSLNETSLDTTENNGHQ